MKADRARRSLAEFTRQAWHVIEPGTELLWNWHIDAICEHLQAVTTGDIRLLVINIPPGHMKSILTSVMWPAWEWIDRPEIRSLFSSYSFELAVRDSVRCRNILESEWYQESFGPIWALHDNEWDFADDQNLKHWFQNTRMGFRFSHSVLGKATGFRGEKVVTDDPLNAIERHSKLKRDRVVDWWDKTMSSRLNDPRTGKRVIIMQRLHEDDPTGHVLEKGGYVHLCLPSEFEPKRRSVTVPLASTGGDVWQDPREEEGELLHPELFNEEVIAQAKKDLGSLDYAGQHQQKPAPSEGTILLRKWWRYYVHAPEEFDEVIQSWDMAFKDTINSAYVVGQVWGRKGPNIYLLDSVRDKMDFAKTCAAVVALSNKWDAYTKLVEDKANGPAVISSLKNQVGGLVAVEPDGTKEARAYACQPALEAGNVFLPAMALPSAPDEEPLLEGWVEAFIDECTFFPNGNYADQVDSFTQAAKRLIIAPLRGESAPGLY